MSGRIRVGLLFLLGTTLLLPPAGAQEQIQIDPHGFELMRMLFERSGLRSAPWPADPNQYRPSESLVVLVGRIRQSDANRVYNFVHSGGAVLLASDRHVGTRGLLIRMGPVLERDRRYFYQGHRDCFRVPIRSEHPVMTGVNELIVNRTGYVRRLAEGWERLAESPSRRRLLAGAYERQGRAVFSADHSLFTNSGLLLSSGNMVFGVNVQRWLAENRRWVSFIVDGVQQQGTSGIPPVLPPVPEIDPGDIPRDTQTAFANRFLRNMQETNALNRWLASVPPWKYWRWLLLIPAVFIMWKLVGRLISGDTTLVRPPAVSRESANEARAAEIFRAGSLQPIARELARDLIRTLREGSSPDRWLIHDDEIVCRAPGAATVVRDLREICEIAVDGNRRPPPARRLRGLAKRIDELKMLHAKGSLRLRPAANST